MKKGGRKRTNGKKNGGKRGANISSKFVMRALAMQVDGCPLKRKPLDFSPIGTKEVYHFVRRTSLINSYTATSGGFVTTNQIATLNQSGAATPVNNLLALAFRLDDLPDYTEFTSLFDQYVILGVQVRITPRASNAVVSGGASNLGPQVIYVAKDCSDIVLPADIQTLREYETVREFSVTTMTNRKWTIGHSPRVAIAGYSGAFSGYTSPTMTWIDLQSPSVQHYGLKLGVPAGQAGGSTTQYDMDFKYHIACRMAQ